MSIDRSDNVVWTREVQLLTGVISGRQAVYPHVHTSRHTVLRHSSPDTDTRACNQSLQLLPIHCSQHQGRPVTSTSHLRHSDDDHYKNATQPPHKNIILCCRISLMWWHLYNPTDARREVLHISALHQQDRGLVDRWRLETSWLVIVDLYLCLLRNAQCWCQVVCQYLSGELTACTAGLLCIVRMSTPGPAPAPSSAPTAPPPLPVSPPAGHTLSSPGVVVARSPRPRPRVRTAVSVPAVRPPSLCTLVTRGCAGAGHTAVCSVPGAEQNWAAPHDPPPPPPHCTPAGWGH